MIQKIFTLAILCFSLAAFCEPEKKYETMDLNQFKNLNSTTEKSKISFTAACKNESGQEIKTGMPGYEACMKRIDFKKTQAKDNSQAPEASVGFSIGQ